jgi:prepilin-type N-terminal cleavage/methylation domain-containing protein
MKTPSPIRQGRPMAFTLIELLVVIAIIGVLASILLPAINKAQGRAKVAEARVQMRQIVNAITSYKADYQRMPTTRIGAGNTDVTFGWDSTGFNPGNSASARGSSSTGMPNNSELVAVLGDLVAFRNGTATTNAGHVLNNRQNEYLSFRESDGNNGTRGVGRDGVYRDPWGRPYIISVDANYDGVTRDNFYRRNQVSQQNAGPPRIGRVGMFNPSNTDDDWHVRAEALVWSYGRDGLANQDDSALNDNNNEDNILSWFGE